MDNVKSALIVFETIAASKQGLGVSEIARLLDLPKSNAQRSLTTLNEAGWLSSLADPTDARRRLWVASPKLAALSRETDREPRLRPLARPQMEELRLATRETVQLMVLDGEVVVLTERLDSPHPLKVVHPLGSRAPLHVIAAGKAVLAFLPEALAKGYLTRPMVAATEKTVTDPALLAGELEQIRRVGFAISDGQLQEDVCGIGAPVFNEHGLVIAAISITAPVSRMSARRIKELAPLLARATAAVSASFKDAR